MEEITYINANLSNFDEELLKQTIKKFDSELTASADQYLYEPKFNFTFNSNDAWAGLVSANKPEPEDKGEEEWIWVTGYKALRRI